MSHLAPGCPLQALEQDSCLSFRYSHAVSFPWQAAPGGQTYNTADVALMTPILAFDIETVPDVAGLRKLHGHGKDISDAEVAQLAFDRRREATGSDFLPLHPHRVVAISCALRDPARLMARAHGAPTRYTSSVF